MKDGSRSTSPWNSTGPGLHGARLMGLVLWLRLVLLGLRKRLRIARHEGLRLARAEGLLVPARHRLHTVVVALVEGVIARAARHLVIGSGKVGIGLPELFLRGGDQAEIMLGVLVVIFGRDRIARALRVARELHVFFRDVRGGAANFHVGAVRLVDPRQRILTLAVVIVVIVVVATPHALCSDRFS